jgi:hypothetical protein
MTCVLNEICTTRLIDDARLYSLQAENEELKHQLELRNKALGLQAKINNALLDDVTRLRSALERIASWEAVHPMGVEWLGAELTSRVKLAQKALEIDKSIEST